VPYKGKSTRKREEAEEGRGRRSGMHGQATRSTAKIEEELCYDLVKSAKSLFFFLFFSFILNIDFLFLFLFF